MSVNFTNKAGTGIVYADGFVNSDGSTVDGYPKFVYKGEFITDSRTVNAGANTTYEITLPTDSGVTGVNNVQIFVENPDTLRLFFSVSASLNKVHVTFVNFATASATIPVMTIKFIVYEYLV